MIDSARFHKSLSQWLLLCLCFVLTSEGLFASEGNSAATNHVGPDTRLVVDAAGDLVVPNNTARIRVGTFALEAVALQAAVEQGNFTGVENAFTELKKGGLSPVALSVREFDGVFYSDLRDVIDSSLAGEAVYTIVDRIPRADIYGDSYFPWEVLIFRHATPLDDQGQPIGQLLVHPDHGELVVGDLGAYSKRLGNGPPTPAYSLAKGGEVAGALLSFSPDGNYLMIGDAASYRIALSPDFAGANWFPVHIPSHGPLSGGDLQFPDLSGVEGLITLYGQVQRRDGTLSEVIEEQTLRLGDRMPLIRNSGISTSIVRVTNAGTGPLTVTDLRLEAEDLELNDPPALPFVLLPNQSRNVAVRAVGAPGTKIGTVVVDSDSIAGTARFPVEAAVAAVPSEFFPFLVNGSPVAEDSDCRRVEFGPVSFDGSFRCTTVRMTIDGRANPAETIDAISLDSSDDFFLPGEPEEWEGKNYVSFGICFAPVEEGVREGTLRLKRSGKPDLTITLSGHAVGVFEPEITDLKINGGASTTDSRIVSINFEWDQDYAPVRYGISGHPNGSFDFQPYDPAVPIQVSLSWGTGQKTVALRLEDPSGEITDAVSESIELTRQTVLVSVAASGGGTVTGGGETLLHDSVTLVATPDPGFSFVRWEGVANLPAKPTVHFAVIRDESVIAVFEKFTDSDDDGLLDDWELSFIGNLDSSGTDDLDLDGVTNEDEQAEGSHPLEFDTDSDGFGDGWDPDATDPNTPEVWQFLAVHYEFEDSGNPVGVVNGGTGTIPPAPFGQIHTTDIATAWVRDNSSPSLGGANALFFDATDGADATRIDTGLTAGNLGLLTGAYTMMAWIRPTAFQEGRGYNDNMLFGQPEGRALHHGIRDGTFHFGHWANDTSGGDAASALNRWTHLAWTYEPNEDPAGNGIQTIIVDGVVVSREPMGPLQQDGEIVIGTSKFLEPTEFWNDRDFTGYVDDIRIYTAPLTAQKIAEIAGVEPTVPVIPPTITDITITPGDPAEISLNWTGGVGQTYVLETSSNLGEWSEIGEAQADGNAGVWTVMQNGGERYYRIRLR